jgi:hypothetical protein
LKEKEKVGICDRDANSFARIGAVMPRLELAPTVARGTMQEPGTGEFVTRLSRCSAGRFGERVRPGAQGGS